MLPYLNLDRQSASKRFKFFVITAFCCFFLKKISLSQDTDTGGFLFSQAPMSYTPFVNSVELMMGTSSRLVYFNSWVILSHFVIVSYCSWLVLS